MKSISNYIKWRFLSLQLLFVVAVVAGVGCVPVVARNTVAPVDVPVQMGRLAIGTPVTVVAQGPVTTDQRTAYGPPVLATTSEVRDSSGNLVIAAGAPVAGTIRSQGPRRVGREAWIVIEVRAVQAVDGSWLPLQGGAEFHGRRRVGVSAGIATTLTALLIIPAPFIYLMRGGDTGLQPGQTIVAYVAG